MLSFRQGRKIHCEAACNLPSLQPHKRRLAWLWLKRKPVCWGQSHSTRSRTPYKTASCYGARRANAPFHVRERVRLHRSWCVWLMKRAHGQAQPARPLTISRAPLGQLKLEMGAERRNDDDGRHASPQALLCKVCRGSSRACLYLRGSLDPCSWRQADLRF